MQKIRTSQSGQGLVEYLIIVCLVSVASIAIMRVVSQNINAKFGQVANIIQGKNASDNGVKMEQVRDSYFKKKDFSNFFSGAVSRSDKDE